MIILIYLSHHCTLSFFSFIEIEYDKNNKPIDIKSFDEEKLKDISELREEIEYFDLIDEEKIIFTDEKNIAYIFQKNK